MHSRNAEGGSRKTGRPRKPRLVCVWRVEGERWIKIIFKKHIVVAMNTRSVHEKDTVEGRKCMPRLFRPVQNTKGVLIILMIHEEHGERG